jgi:hypothetical protein
VTGGQAWRIGLAAQSINGNNLPFQLRDSHSLEMSDPCRMVLSMTTTLPELDRRVSVLEEFVRRDLSVRFDAMNWTLAQTLANTETTRQDVASIKVDMAHLESAAHADTMSVKTNLDLRLSDVRRDLRTTEASIRHDMRQGFEAVNRRFAGLEAKVDTILAEIRNGKN